MPQKSLISHLKRLARRTRRSTDSLQDASREKGGRLRLVRCEYEEHDHERHPVEECTMDIVVKSALENGILTLEDLPQSSMDGGVAIDWRTVCLTMNSESPQRATTIRRYAAEIYGFQPVIVCQVGTLVLAHMLKSRISRRMWTECFRLDCLPVAPHGRTLSSTGRLMLASPDPSRAAVRNFSRSVIPGDSTIAYTDASVISELKSLLVGELPYVAAAAGDLSADTPTPSMYASVA